MKVLAIKNLNLCNVEVSFKNYNADSNWVNLCLNNLGNINYKVRHKRMERTAVLTGHLHSHEGYPKILLEKYCPMYVFIAQIKVKCNIWRYNLHVQLHSFF